MGRRADAQTPRGVGGPRGGQPGGSPLLKGGAETNPPGIPERVGIIIPIIYIYIYICLLEKERIALAGYAVAKCVGDAASMVWENSFAAGVGVANAMLTLFTFHLCSRMEPGKDGMMSGMSLSSQIGRGYSWFQNERNPSTTLMPTYDHKKKQQVYTISAGPTGATRM